MTAPLENERSASWSKNWASRPFGSPLPFVRVPHAKDVDRRPLRRTAGRNFPPPLGRGEIESCRAPNPRIFRFTGCCLHFFKMQSIDLAGNALISFTLKGPGTYR